MKIIPEESARSEVRIIASGRTRALSLVRVHGRSRMLALAMPKLVEQVAESPAIKQGAGPGDVTHHFKAHGRHANAFSVAFDPDLKRHTDAFGTLAYTQSNILGVTTVMFDPLCSHDNLPHLIDNFMRAMEQHADQRYVFWKVGSDVADLLAERGYTMAPYGIENRCPLPINLAGTRLRGLRREIAAARRHGLVVEPIEAEASWEGVRSVTKSWLSTRPQPFMVRRVTRRTPHAHEEYCTKVVARTPAGEIVGWAALDHIYSYGKLVGCGLNAVRYDGQAARGVAALLALEGALIVSEKAAGPFHLELGESPMPNPEYLEGLGSLYCDSQFLEAIFRLVREHGHMIYGVEGLANWKRKWRAEQSVTYCAISSPNELPLRETLAVVEAMFI